MKRVSTTGAAADPRLPGAYADQERSHRAKRRRAKGRKRLLVSSRRYGQVASSHGIHQGSSGDPAMGRFMTCFAWRTAWTPRLRIAASAKMGNAVARNRAKRLRRAVSSSCAINS